MRTSKLVLEKAHEVSAAYKILKPYVCDSEYVAYVQGLHDAIAILQEHEEKLSIDKAMMGLVDGN